MAKDLIKNSKKLCEEAAEVLATINTIGAFSRLGKIEIIGSLRLELMYRRDIDLLIISEDIDKSKAQAITKKFLDSGVFQTVSLADYQTFPAFDMPLGFYWELIVPHLGKNWKFDIWYLKPGEKYTNFVLTAIKKFKEALSKNPKKVETILKIKEAYFDGVKYRDKVNGFDIYTAVLENGVNTVEGFARIKSLHRKISQKL